MTPEPLVEIREYGGTWLRRPAEGRNGMTRMQLYFATPELAEEWLGDVSAALADARVAAAEHAEGPP
jgi:hypothetical protein